MVHPGQRINPHRDTMGRSSMDGSRVHYRIVFKEVCTPVLSNTSVSVMCGALADISEGTCKLSRSWIWLTYSFLVLRILHENQWVHRDISFNNILLDGEGHARLTDLEFAKRSADKTSPEFALVCPLALARPDCTLTPVMLGHMRIHVDRSCSTRLRVPPR